MGGIILPNYMIVAYFIILFILGSCGNETVTKKYGIDYEYEEHRDELQTEDEVHTVKEIMEADPDADIFILDQVIYENGTDLEWIQKLKLEIGDEVAEIEIRTTKSDELTDNAATKLPVGTKIYKVNNFKGPVYIAIVEENAIPYVGIVP